MPAFIHTCDGIGDLLGSMVEAGTAGIDTLDSPPLGDIDFPSVKAQVDDNMFLEGNMNPVELLQLRQRKKSLPTRRTESQLESQVAATS